MIEKEIKYVLSKEQLMKIEDELSKKNKPIEVIQINYYYDNEEEELLKNGITLRVRQIEGQKKLEIKYPMSFDGLIKTKEEKYRTIEELPRFVDFTKENFFNKEWKLNRFKNVKMIGILITHRKSYTYNDGIKIELDKSFYLGHTDYEIEIEIDKGYEEEVIKVIDKIIPEGTCVAKEGKRKRFHNFMTKYNTR